MKLALIMVSYSFCIFLSIYISFLKKKNGIEDVLSVGAVALVVLVSSFVLVFRTTLQFMDVG